MGILLDLLKSQQPDASRLHAEAYPGWELPKRQEGKTALAFSLVILLPVTFGVWAAHSEVHLVEETAHADTTIESPTWHDRTEQPRSPSVSPETVPARDPSASAHDTRFERLREDYRSWPPLLRITWAILVHALFVLPLSPLWIRVVAKLAGTRSPDEASSEAWRWSCQTYMVFVIAASMALSWLGFTLGIKATITYAATFYLVVIFTWKPYAHTVYKALTERGHSHAQQYQ